jgi:hypothetical protein
MMHGQKNIKTLVCVEVKDETMEHHKHICDLIPQNKYCGHLAKTEKAQIVVVGYEWRCSQYSVTLRVLVS